MTLQDGIAPPGSSVEHIFSFSFVDEVFRQACLRERAAFSWFFKYLQNLLLSTHNVSTGQKWAEIVIVTFYNGKLRYQV